MTDIDPAFGNWFAGFTDGEGSFNISIIKNRKVNPRVKLFYVCEFSIILRIDDKPILQEVQTRLGIGKIRDESHRPNASPQVKFRVDRQSECRILRDFFLTYPLRAKKARDLEIWSKAIDCFSAHKIGDSWENVANLRNQLMTDRRFKEVA